MNSCKEQNQALKSKENIFQFTWCLDANPTRRERICYWWKTKLDKFLREKKSWGFLRRGNRESPHQGPTSINYRPRVLLSLLRVNFIFVPMHSSLFHFNYYSLVFCNIALLFSQCSNVPCKPIFPIGVWDFFLLLLLLFMNHICVGVLKGKKNKRNINMKRLVLC